MSKFITLGDCEYFYELGFKLVKYKDELFFMKERN